MVSPPAVSEREYSHLFVQGESAAAEWTAFIRGFVSEILEKSVNSMNFSQETSQSACTNKLKINR